MHTTSCDAKYSSRLEMPFFFVLYSSPSSVAEWLNKCHTSESGELDEMDWNCGGAFVMNGVSSCFTYVIFFLSKVRAVWNVRVVSFALLSLYCVHYRDAVDAILLFFFSFLCDCALR